MSIVRLRWLYAVQGAALGLLLPYLVPLMAGRGLSATEIGLVLGASGLVSLASYPMWGALADGPLGRRRAIGATASVAVIGGLWVVAAGSDPVVLAGAVSLTLAGAVPWGAISDAIALNSLGDRSGAYGRLRAFASLGWAASAIVAGFAWDRVGGSTVLLAFAAAAAVVAATALLPSRRTLAGGEAPAGGASSAVRDGPSRPGIRTEWRTVLGSPVLIGFLIAILITAIGVSANWRYVSLRILDQGGGTLLVGLAAALPALVETPVFMGSMRWTRLLGLRWLYVGGALVGSALFFLIGFATEPWVIAALRTVDGTSYALRHIGMVLIIGALLPPRFHAFGQSLGWFMAVGVAPIIADIFGGLIYDSLGGGAVFLVASSLALAGAVVAFVALAGAGFGRAAAVRPPSTAFDGESAPVVVDR